MGSLSEEDEVTEDPKKRKRLVKTSEQKPRSTRSAAAQANSDPKVDVAGRLETLFGKDDDSEASPEINGNAESSEDDVQKWAEVDGED